MYNYLVCNINERKLYKDFLSYHKRSESDEYYVVALDNPELIKYLMEFLERRLN